MTTTQREICDWAAETFPDAEMGDVTSKMYDEMIELYQDVTCRHDEGVGAEIADVVIMLYQIADRCGVDLEQAVINKMAVNKARTWGKADDRGVVRHSETMTAAQRLYDLYRDDSPLLPLWDDLSAKARSRYEELAARHAEATR